MVVRPAAEQERYQRSVQIILGTVFSFAGVAAAVIVLVCVCRRGRTAQTGEINT